MNENLRKLVKEFDQRAIEMAELKKKLKAQVDANNAVRKPATKKYQHKNKK